MKNLKKNIVIIASIVIFSLYPFFSGCNFNINLDKLTNDKVVQSPYDVINRISLEKMRANLAVYVTEYVTDKSSGLEYTGSGMIIKCEKRQTGFIVVQTEYTFYFLTNNHVVCGGKNGLEYKVYDYLERSFTAQFINSSASYDLALLKFTVRESDLTITRDGVDEIVEPLIIDFAENSELKYGDYVFVVGQPHKQRNAITVGKYLYKEKVGRSDSVYSLIDFDVLHSDAYTTNGSSGGMMLNADLKLVGVVFGGLFSSDTQQFNKSCAIPIERVNEFLDYCGITVENGNPNDESEAVTGIVA